MSATNASCVCCGERNHKLRCTYNLLAELELLRVGDTIGEQETKKFSAQHTQHREIFFTQKSSDKHVITKTSLRNNTSSGRNIYTLCQNRALLIQRDLLKKADQAIDYCRLKMDMPKSFVSALWIMAAFMLLLSVTTASYIYPPNHWEFSKELKTVENITATIEEMVDSGKTLFIRFIAAEKSHFCR